MNADDYRINHLARKINDLESDLGAIQRQMSEGPCHKFALADAFERAPQFWAMLAEYRLLTDLATRLGGEMDNVLVAQFQDRLITEIANLTGGSRSSSPAPEMRFRAEDQGRINALRFIRSL